MTKERHFWYNLPVSIETDEQFEDKLAQLARMYRAARKIFEKTNTSENAQVGRWVVAGGRVVDMITALLAELEDYTGCADLRLILTELEAVRRDREAKTQKG